MIFCKDLLFLHIPKTGGMSMTRHLLDVLPKPIYYMHELPDTSTADAGIVQFYGLRHETLDGARRIVREYGFEVEAFPMILVVLRNPYEQEVSRYAYLKQGHEKDAGYEQSLAMREDFETFAVRSRFGAPIEPIEKFLLIDGEVPSNLRVLRLESIDEELPSALRDIGIEPVGALPRQNTSPHHDYRLYYSRAAESAVYLRYRWIFDNGYYQRMDPDAFPFVASAPLHGEQLPIRGPAHLTGPSVGLWPDSWVGEHLWFRVAVEELVETVSIEGWIPGRIDEPVRLGVTVDGVGASGSFSGGEPFTWEVPCHLPRETEVEVVVTAERMWCPRDSEWSKDERPLSFLLRRIRFEPQRRPSDVETLPDSPALSRGH
jgi:hypothetical protein